MTYDKMSPWLFLLILAASGFAVGLGVTGHDMDGSWKFMLVTIVFILSGIAVYAFKTKVEEEGNVAAKVKGLDAGTEWNDARLYTLCELLRDFNLLFSETPAERVKIMGEMEDGPHKSRCRLFLDCDVKVMVNVIQGLKDEQLELTMEKLSD